MVGQNVETRSCGIHGTSNRKQWRETTLLHQPKIKEITTCITSHWPWNYNCNCSIFKHERGSTTVSIRHSEHSTFLSFDVSSYTPHCLNSLKQRRKKHWKKQNLDNRVWLNFKILLLVQGQDIFCRVDDSLPLAESLDLAESLSLAAASGPVLTTLCAGGAVSGSSHFRLRPRWSRLSRPPRRLSLYSRWPLGAKWATANSRIWWIYFIGEIV